MGLACLPKRASEVAQSAAVWYLGKGREVKHNNKVMGAIACGLSLAITLCGPLSAIPAYAATVTFNQDLAGAKVANRTFNAYKIATFTPEADGNVYTFVDGAKPVVTQVLTDMGVDMTGVTTDASRPSSPTAIPPHLRLSPRNTRSTSTPLALRSRRASLTKRTSSTRSSLVLPVVTVTSTLLALTATTRWSSRVPTAR